MSIPIGRRLPLADAAQERALAEKGGAGRVLLLPCFRRRCSRE